MSVFLLPVGQFSCGIAKRWPTLIEIAVKLEHVLQLFLSTFLNNQSCMKHTPSYSSVFMKLLFVDLDWLVCGLSLMCHRMWMTCVCESPTGKMAAKQPHQVLLLCLDIHLGNSNRAIITASSWASSSIYSCWIFLGLLRSFIVNTVVCVVPRAHSPAAPQKWYAYHIKLEQFAVKMRRCKQSVSLGLGLLWCLQLLSVSSWGTQSHTVVAVTI